MRILSIENLRVIIEVDRKELDNILSIMMEDQYRKGYEDGYNDCERVNNANMDNDNSKKD